ncbi:MAG: hypothetical protein IJ865_03610 [Clostridia bacterium]|nr:hypothetical protein [Clostridia bacterium]
MSTCVRYLSRSGNTRKIAQAIAEGAGVEAVSITEEKQITEPVDVLFLGGAPYANIMDKELRAYAEALDPKLVGRVVLFTTSNWSRRTVHALRKLLTEKGIRVEEDFFFAHMLKISAREDDARDFGRKYAK